MLEKLNNQERLINYQKLYLKGGNNVECDFSDYRSLKEFFKAICYRKITIEEAEAIQEECNAAFGALENYAPKKEKYVSGRKGLLINAKKIYEGRQMIIDSFKNKIFPKAPTGFENDVDEDELFKKCQEEDGRLPTIEEEPEDEILGTSSTSEQMARLGKIYAPLSSRYFMEKSFIGIINKLKNYKENPEKLQIYNSLIVRLNIGLERLENDIKKMSKGKVKEREHLGYLKDLVRTIVDAGQKYDMAPLETEEEPEKRQKGQGLKIMMPSQLITRLPVLLSQIAAGNNSNKLKNEIRQIIYSLYRSKNLSKTIYNHLINSI